MSNQDNIEVVSAREDNLQVVRAAQSSIAAMAAEAEAVVKAQFFIAQAHKRNWNAIRIDLKDLCKDPEFASIALYVKPLAATPNDWDKIDQRERVRRRLDGEVANWPMGFSIRAIEAFLFAAGNYLVDSAVVFEDAEERKTRVRIIDLEKNNVRMRMITTPKTVERSYKQRGQEPLDVRYNSKDQLVYIYPASPAQVNNAEAAEVSKATRTIGESMLPPGLRAELRRLVEDTVLNQDALDPQRAIKSIFDSFAGFGVRPEMVEKYLEHPLNAIQPAEISALRKILVAVSQGEITWRDVMEQKFGPDSEKEGDKPRSEGASKVDEILKKQTKSDPPANQQQQTTSQGPREAPPRRPTEQDRSEGTPSPSEGPNARGKSPWLLRAGRRSVFPRLAVRAKP